MFEHDYRICFPKAQVYVSRNHQWAFAAWAMGKKSGTLGTKVSLLHVDAHLDDTWDGVVVEGLREMNDDQDYLEVASKLEIDNFIWAGFAAKLIDHIVYVSPKDVDESDPFDLSAWNLEGKQLKPIKELLTEREYKGLRFESILDFKQQLMNGSTQQQIFDLSNSVILDLDLDVFKLNLHNPEDSALMLEVQIKEELTFLKELHPYDMITVALSPSFCGGEKNSKWLYGLFLEVFQLKLSDSVQW
jgi:hypothetical protein